MRASLSRVGVFGLLCCCGEPTAGGDATTQMASSGEVMTAGTSGGSGTGEQPTGEGDTEDEAVRCGAEGCSLDILLVIDNSSSMGEEQARLTASMPALVEGLREFKDGDGELLTVDVNIMVTTTDMGHPLCGAATDEYAPALGAPTVTPCTQRLSHFEAPVSLPGLCTDACPEGQAAVAMDPFIHFKGDDHNVVDPDGVGDPVVDALRCLAPQGLRGCEMAAPLEAMLQALDPGQPWNLGVRPFLREEAVLVVIVVSDATDCSLAAGGEPFFDPKHVDDPAFNLHWEDVPGMPGVKQTPTAAVCWNGAMSCEAGEEPGVYAGCVPEEKGVLQPLGRYTDHWEALRGQGKPVVMLALTGVPTVSEHNVDRPFEPSKGGVKALVFRDWSDEDLLASDVAMMTTAADQQFRRGIGPGCVSEPGTQGLPPGRIQSVCEALDVADDPETPKKDETAVRCRLESICDDSYDRALKALIGGLGPPFGKLGPAPG